MLGMGGRNDEHTEQDRAIASLIATLMVLIMGMSAFLIWYTNTDYYTPCDQRTTCYQVDP